MKPTAPFRKRVQSCLPRHPAVAYLRLVRSDQVTVTLRKVMQEDLPIFFEHQLDAAATRMAAFPSRDRDAFMAHWARIMSNETRDRILNTILTDDIVAGNVVLLGSGGGTEHRLLARQDTLGEGDCKCGPDAIFDEDRGATSLRACGKAQCRFDTCLTKMRVSTCTRGSCDGDDGEELVMELRSVRCATASNEPTKT